MDTISTIGQVALPPLLERARQRANETGLATLVRLPAPRPWKDPWSLAPMALQSGERCALWADPEGKMLAVGIGEAASVRAQGSNRFQQLHEGLQRFSQNVLSHEELQSLPMWFGGFAFRSLVDANDTTWSSWREDMFVTHEITAIQVERKSWTVLSLCIEPNTAPSDIFQRYDRLCGIVETLRALSTSSAAQLGAATPSLVFSDEQQRGGWVQTVESAKKAIRDGRLAKVVLARRILAPWPEPSASTPVPARLTHALRTLRTRYAHCTTFAFTQPATVGEDGVLDTGSQQTFFGSTPELLIARQGERIHTMALAGTAPRGATPEEDRANEYALLGSEKEREEHRFVVDDIVQALGRLDIQVRPSFVPDVVSFPNVHHLCTPIHAPAPEHISLIQLAEALHPTPAVCGAPGPVAFAWLKENEPLDRGWYAGGVGWLSDKLDGRICVALRSALSSAEGVSAFAGAGIVEGSDPNREWDETLAKLSTIRDAFAAPAPEITNPPSNA